VRLKRRGLCLLGSVWARPPPARPRLGPRALAHGGLDASRRAWGAPLGKICRRQAEGDLRRATRGAGGAPTCEDGRGQGHGHGSAVGKTLG
jgi:hypothetical protein